MLMNGENYKQINKNEENNNLSPKVNLKDSKENQSAKFSIVSNDSLVQSNNNLNEHFFDSNNINDENIENEENENEEENDDEKEENNEEENEINEINDENNDVQIFFHKRKKFILELNEFQYKHIKKYSTIKEKKCSICLNKYKSPDIIKEFPCKHIFHKTCILKWLKNSDRCPICKYDISKDINNMEFDKLISDDEKEDES
jgi:hypothetical protein